MDESNSNSNKNNNKSEIINTKTDNKKSCNNEINIENKGIEGKERKFDKKDGDSKFLSNDNTKENEDKEKEFIINNNNENENNSSSESSSESSEEKEIDKIDNNKESKDKEKIHLIVPKEKGKLTERLYEFFKTGFVWRPIPTIKKTVGCLEITGVIFLCLGIAILVLTNNIKEIVIRYDDNIDCSDTTSCTIDFEVKEDMKQPVMVYYQLTNFYQNHRRYFKSKSIKQLKGNILDYKDVKNDCDPVLKNSDIYEGIKNFNGGELDPNGIAHPCGLIARSFFNDTFKIINKNSKTEISIKSKGIAWKSDVKKFKNTDKPELQWLNVEDERFLVWIRPAPLPEFRKIWGRIEETILKGNYTLKIENVFPVKQFKGEKRFVLSTVNALGGKNKMLGIGYIVLGGISIVAGIAFLIGYYRFNAEDKKEKNN